MGYIFMGTTPQWYFQTDKVYLGWSYVKDLYQIQILKKQWSQQTKSIVFMEIKKIWNAYLDN